MFPMMFWASPDESIQTSTMNKFFNLIPKLGTIFDIVVMVTMIKIDLVWILTHRVLLHSLGLGDLTTYLHKDLCPRDIKGSIIHKFSWWR